MSVAAASKLHLLTTASTSSKRSGKNTTQDTTANFYNTNRTIKCTTNTHTEVRGDEFGAKTANFTA